MNLVELGKKALVRAVNRRYLYGYGWTWKTLLDATGSEDFNEPYILDAGHDFIDGGAAYGLWSVRAAKYYDNVYAFEPDPRVFPHLLKNLGINGIWNVRALPYALGSVDASETSFFQYGIGSSSLLVNHMGMRRGQETYHVPQITIDTIVSRDHLHPSLIKLDTEGAEVEVLKGATKTIDDFKPKLIIEVHHPVMPEQVEEMFPEYSWTRRLRYLNTNLYPFEYQSHLLGLPSLVSQK